MRTNGFNAAPYMSRYNSKYLNDLVTGDQYKSGSNRDNAPLAGNSMNIQEYDQKGGHRSHRVFQIWSQIKTVDNDALPQINDLSDLDGVVFTEFTTSEAKLGSSLDLPDKNAMRSLLQFELAELGIYQGSEFKISRLLNFIYSTAFNENIIHVYTDDREDILNALYNFFKIYPQFFHGKIVFFKSDPIETSIKPCFFRESTVYEKSIGYPNFIIDQEALNRVDVIASWEGFYQTYKDGLLESYPKDMRLCLDPGSITLETREKVCAYLLEYQRKARRKFIKGQLSLFQSTNTEALPTCIIQGALLEQQNPKLQRALVTMVGAIEKEHYTESKKQEKDWFRSVDDRVLTSIGYNKADVGLEKNIKDQMQSLLKVLLAKHKSLLESSGSIEQKEADREFPLIINHRNTDYTYNDINELNDAILDLKQGLIDNQVRLYKQNESHKNIRYRKQVGIFFERWSSEHVACLQKIQGNKTSQNGLFPILAAILAETAEHIFDESHIKKPGEVLQYYFNLIQERAPLIEVVVEGTNESRAPLVSITSTRLLSSSGTTSYNYHTGQSIQSMADLKGWMESVGVNIELITNHLSNSRCPVLYTQLLTFIFHSAPGLIGPFDWDQSTNMPVVSFRGEEVVADGSQIISSVDSDQERVLYITLYNRNPHPNLTTLPQSVVPLLSQHIFDEKRFDDKGVVYQQRAYDPRLRENMIGQKKGVTLDVKTLADDNAKAVPSFDAILRKEVQKVFPQYRDKMLNRKGFTDFNFPLRQRLIFAMQARKFLGGLDRFLKTDKGNVFFDNLADMLSLTGDLHDKRARAVTYWEVMLYTFLDNHPFQHITVPKGFSPQKLLLLRRFYSNKMFLKSFRKVYDRATSKFVRFINGNVRRNDKNVINFRQMCAKKYDDMTFQVDDSTSLSNDKTPGLLDSFNQRYETLKRSLCNLVLPEIDVNDVNLDEKECHNILLVYNQTLREYTPYTDIITFNYASVNLSCESPYTHYTSDKQLYDCFNKLLSYYASEMPKDCADEDDFLNKKARYLIAFAKLLMFPNKDHWDGSLNVELFNYNMKQFFVNGIVLGHITKEVVFFLTAISQTLTNRTCHEDFLLVFRGELIRQIKTKPVQDVISNVSHLSLTCMLENMPSMDVITPKAHSDEPKATARTQMAPVAKTTGELNSKINQIEDEVGFRFGLEGIVKLVQHPGMQAVLDQYAPIDESRDITVARITNPYLRMLAFLKLVDLTTNQTGPLLFKQMMVLNAMLNTQPAHFDAVTVDKIHCDTSGIFYAPNNSSENATDYNLMPIFMAIHLKLLTPKKLYAFVNAIQGWVDQIDRTGLDKEIRYLCAFYTNWIDRIKRLRLYTEKESFPFLEVTKFSPKLRRLLPPGYPIITGDFARKLFEALVVRVPEYSSRKVIDNIAKVLELLGRCYVLSVYTLQPMTLKDYTSLEAFKILVIFNSVYALADSISLAERCYMIYTQRKSNISLLLIIDNVLLIGLALLTLGIWATPLSDPKVGNQTNITITTAHSAEENYQRLLLDLTEMLDSNLLILFAKLSVTFGVGGVKLADALKDIGAQLFNLIVKLITKIRIATIKRTFSRTHLACLRRAQCQSPLTNKEFQALQEDFRERKDQIDIDLRALTASSPHIVKGLFFNAFLYAASVFGFNPAVNLVNNLGLTRLASFISQVVSTGVGNWGPQIFNLFSLLSKVKHMKAGYWPFALTIAGAVALTYIDLQQFIQDNLQNQTIDNGTITTISPITTIAATTAGANHSANDMPTWLVELVALVSSQTFWQVAIVLVQAVAFISILSKAFGVGNPNTSAWLNVEHRMRNDANRPFCEYPSCFRPNNVKLSSANRDKKLEVRTYGSTSSSRL